MKKRGEEKKRKERRGEEKKRKERRGEEKRREEKRREERRRSEMGMAYVIPMLWSRFLSLYIDFIFLL